jgi:hypothetical protein
MSTSSEGIAEAEGDNLNRPGLEVFLLANDGKSIGKDTADTKHSHSICSTILNGPYFQVVSCLVLLHGKRRGGMSLLISTWLDLDFEELYD